MPRILGFYAALAGLYTAVRLFAVSLGCWRHTDADSAMATLVIGVSAAITAAISHNAREAAASKAKIAAMEADLAASRRRM